MIKKLYNKRFIFIAVGLLTAVSLISGIVFSQAVKKSDAKNISQTEESYDAELADFDMDFSLTYTSGGNPVTLSSGDLSAQHGVVRLTKAEYNTMKLNAEYTGPGECYYRFKITESWLHSEIVDGNPTDIITPKELSTYQFGTDMYDNRSYDNCIYSSVPLKDDNRSIEVISSCTEGADAADLLDPAHASQYVDISVEFEAVQWNRAAKIWGFSELPWLS